MSETDKSTPYLSVDFGEQGGRHEWITPEDAETWVTELQSQWRWVQQEGGQFIPTQRAWQNINSPLQDALSYLQQARSSRDKNPQHAGTQLDAARSTLEQHIRKYPWLLQNSAQRLFVEEVRSSEHPLVAALIVSIWTGHDLEGAPPRYSMDAVLQWRLFERGNKERVKFESASLKKLSGDMQTQLTQFQEAERAQANRFDLLYENLIAQQGNHQDAFDNAQQNRTDSWQQQSSTAQQELDNIKTTYDQHMAIAAPVEYWEKKREKHHRMARRSGIAVIIGMLVIGIFLSWKMQSISTDILSPPAQQAAASATLAASSVPATATAASATWHLGSFIMLAVLCFWAIRLLVRIFLSNMHLENDAAERVTMAKTYLALIRSDSLSKDKNIDAVLAALFRPTGDGIVKDDGIPPSTVDYLTKLGK